MSDSKLDGWTGGTEFYDFFNTKWSCGLTIWNSTNSPKEIPVWVSDHAPLSKEQIVKEFYEAVCKRAEENMLKTGKLEGAHFAAMRQELEKILPHKDNSAEGGE